MKSVLISKLLFVTVVASLFYAFVHYQADMVFAPFKSYNKNLVLTSVIFAGVVYALVLLANVFGRESYKSLSPNMCRGGWPENWQKLDNSRTMVKPLSTKKVLNVGWPENWQFFLEVY